MSSPIPPPLSDPPSQRESQERLLSPDADLRSEDGLDSETPFALLFPKQLQLSYGEPHVSIRLARKIHAIDRKDENVLKSKTYRASTTKKDLEQTTVVLHHLHQRTKLALMKRSFVELEECADVLPDQLEGELGDDNSSYKKEKDKERLPVIYLHSHVNKEGLPPTMNEYDRVVEVVERYADYIATRREKRGPANNDPDKAMVDKVDRMVKKRKSTEVAGDPSASGEGNGRFKKKNYKHELVDWDPDDDSGKPRYGDSQELLTGLRQWIASMRGLRLNIPAHERDNPVPGCNMEAGWAIKPYERRFQHHIHESSNNIMNIVDAATRYCAEVGGWEIDSAGDGLKPRVYRMRWKIIMEVVQPDLAGPAERTVSRLSSSYTTCGGFNGVFGGLSVQGAHNTTAKVWNQQCRKLQDIIARSAQHDDDIIRKESEQLRADQQTESNKSRIKELRQEHEKLGGEIKTSREQAKSYDEELEALAQKWIEDVGLEMKAIEEGKRVAKLKEVLDRL